MRYLALLESGWIEEARYTEMRQDEIATRRLLGKRLPIKRSLGRSIYPQEMDFFVEGHRAKAVNNRR